MSLPGRPDLDLRAPWVAVDDGNGLQQELAREVSPGHQLYGARVRAVARRVDCDDVLFEILDAAPSRYAVVHLTWHRETVSTWPSAALYDNVEDWRARCMAVDA